MKLFRRKTKKEKLAIQYRKKLEEARAMSTVNRSKADQLTYEAEQILKQMEDSI
jgi:hypothetical protein